MAEENERGKGLGPSVNWGSLFAGLSNTLQKADTDKRKKTEDREILAAKAANTISNLSYGTDTKSYQQVTRGGLEDVKEGLKKMSDALANREITAAQYEQYKMNMNNSMAAWSSGSLDYDKNIEAFKKQQNTEEGVSYFTALLYDNYLSNGDMTGKSMLFDENGTGYITKFNEDNQIIERENIQNIQNPNNFNSVLINATESVEELTDTFNPEQVINADGSITKNYQNDETYAGRVSSFIAKKLKDPRSALSVLNDNGFQNVDKETGFISTYEVYRNDEQREAMLDERVLIAKASILEPREVPVLDDNKKQRKNSDGSPMTEMVGGTEMTPDQEKAFREEQESYLLAVVSDSQGNLQPVITSQFRTDAGNFLKEIINSQIGSTYRPKPRPRVIRPAKEEKPVDPNDFAVVNDIDNLLKNKGKNLNPKQIQDINQALVNRVVRGEVVFHEGQFKVLDGEKNTAKRYAEGVSKNWAIANGFRGTVLNNAEDFAKYFIGGNSSLDTYRKKKALRDKEGGGKNTDKELAEKLINQYSK